MHPRASLSRLVLASANAGRGALERLRRTAALKGKIANSRVQHKYYQNWNWPHEPLTQCGNPKQEHHDQHVTDKDEEE